MNLNLIGDLLSQEQLHALTSLPTPVNRKRFIDLLISSHYDPVLTACLDLGFRNGFDIGHRGPVSSDLKVRNLKIFFATSRGGISGLR